MKENELIAEFMGVDQVDIDQAYDDYGELRYHTEWNWMMPVVQKIKNTPTFEGCDGIDFVLNCDLTIENLYDSVVEFINEYNK
tara:strand:- start:262 stop:510 length:249 start_codon:yes stop_codon:yes gene_type:complete